MQLKKFLRFLLLLFFLAIASLVPVPINFYKKDKLPSFKVEQLDKKEDEEKENDAYQAFS